MPLRPPPLGRLARLSSLLTRISSNTFCTTLLPPPLPAISHLLPPPSPSLTSSLVSSFSQWFLSHPPNSPNYLLNRVYAALASSSNEDGLQQSLSSLDLALSESFLLSFLHHKPFLNRPITDPNQLLLLRLRFFDWSGRQHPYRHSRSVYHDLFLLLKKSDKSPLILQWLNLFTNSHSPSSSPNPHPRFHDTLIIAYSIAGQPELALTVLGKMRFTGLNPDRLAIHVLMNSLVDNSLFSYFDSIFPTLPFEDPVGMSIKFKSLCARSRLDSAENLLRSLPNHISTRGSMASMLVKSLCKKGKFVKASEIVEEFPCEETYSVWLTSLLYHGRLDQSLQFLSDKNASEDYIPNKNGYKQLITHLLRKNLLDPACDSLIQVIEKGVLPTSVLMSAALRFFCKAGLVEIALNLYNKRAELGIDPHRLVFDDLIGALCSEGETEKACKVLEDSMDRGYFLGRRTFARLAKILSREGKLDWLRALLDAAVKRDFKPSSYTLASYLASLCKAGHLAEACLVPYMVPQTSGTGTAVYKHQQTYISLIQAFAHLKRVDMLPELLIKMQETGHSPSRSLFRLVVSTLCEMEKFGDVLGLLNRQLEIKALSEKICYNYFIEGAFHAKKSDMAREVYNRMESAGIQPSKDTNIILLRGYLSNIKISDALNFFELLRAKEEPNNKLYNVIITGLCNAGRPVEATEFWRECRSKNLVPSLECYEELARVSGYVQDYDTLVKLIEDFEGTCRPASPYLCNVILFHTLKSRDLLKAWFGLHEKGDGRFGQLIAAFSGGIRMRDNINKIEEEFMKNFPMDIFTYNTLLREFSNEGRMDLASDLFDRMVKKGYVPNRWTFDIMVHGYCKEGDRIKAEKWLQALSRHGFVPTHRTLKYFRW